MKDSGHSWFAKEDFPKALIDLEASRAKVKELEEHIKFHHELRIKELERMNETNARLHEAETILLRCEFGLQPEFYGGKDNGSLKDVRHYLDRYKVAR